MDVSILVAKLILAATLLVAAGAKFADMSSFSATLRLFLFRRAGSASTRLIAALIVAGEFLLGVMSLAMPAIAWINYAVLAVCVAFVAASGVGYAIFRGRTCQCFGALSQRKFDLLGIGRSVILLAMAAVAIGPVKSASLQLGIVPTLVLLALAMLLSASALVAARALDVVPEA